MTWVMQTQSPRQQRNHWTPLAAFAGLITNNNPANAKSEGWISQLQPLRVPLRISLPAPLQASALGTSSVASARHSAWRSVKVPASQTRLGFCDPRAVLRPFPCSSSEKLALTSSSPKRRTCP